MCPCQGLYHFKMNHAFHSEIKHVSMFPVKLWYELFICDREDQDHPVSLWIHRLSCLHVWQASFPRVRKGTGKPDIKKKKTNQ